MYGFKKFLFSLIPQIVLGLALCGVSYFAVGFPKMFSEYFTFPFMGLCMGGVIMMSFLNDYETRTAGKVFCWIFFFLFGFMALLMPGMYIQHGSSTNELLLFHVSVGFQAASAITFIYLFIVLRVRLGEDHNIATKMIVPLILVIGGTIGGGYLSLLGDKLCQTLSYVFEFAPLGIIILLLIIFAKMDIAVSSGSSRGYSSHSYDNDYSSSSSDDDNYSSSSGPSENDIWYALYDLSVSYTVGCTVTLTITGVTVNGNSVNIEYEERVEHVWHGNEDYDKAHRIAENNLFSEAKRKLRSIGCNLDLY